MHFIDVPIHVGVSDGNLVTMNIIKQPSLPFSNIITMSLAKTVYTDCLTVARKFLNLSI